MNLIVTNLLTATKDPSRRKQWQPDPNLAAGLRDSIAAHGQHLVVLHDSLHVDNDDSTSYVRMPKGGNPYFARWRNIVSFLKRCRDVVEFVWCVDATDVVMLHDPFPHMQPDAFYSGSEPRPLGGDTIFHDWLYRHHPSRAEFYAAHPDRPFLNPGIIGGGVAAVIAAARALGSEPDGDLTDMGAWQQIALALFGDRLMTGHPVHTEYKAFQLDDPEAWWAHK